ncbi:hypothetical protein BKA70DRAFT_1227616 [Coprinopsis sp. MPI-PUGE-AT-0042]|nr:hypothetical protein BKA70DRAFT_1227616 [Coprinopsis sp. MPI-PUGE-AT-0042]
MSTTFSPGRTFPKRRPDDVLSRQENWKQSKSSASRPATSTGYEMTGCSSRFQYSISTVSLLYPEPVMDCARSSRGSTSSSVTLVDSPSLPSGGTSSPRRPRKLTRRRTQSNAEERWDGLKRKEGGDEKGRHNQGDAKVMDTTIPAKSCPKFPHAKHGILPPRDLLPQKETPLDVHRRLDIRRILSQPTLVATKVDPQPPLPLKVASPCRNHSPRSVAPPSSFRFPIMSPPDDLSTRPPPPKPQPSADVQRILAQPTLLAPIKRPISRCRSVGDLASPPPTPSTVSSETLAEVPRRPRKLQRPRSRCSSTTSLALPSVPGSTPVEHHNQEWFVLNAVQPGEGWDEDKIRVGTPTEEVPQAAAELALRVRSRVQSSLSQSTSNVSTISVLPGPQGKAIALQPVVPLPVKDGHTQTDSQAGAVDATPSDHKLMSRCRSWFNHKLSIGRRSPKRHAPPSSFPPLAAGLATSL